VRRASGHGRPSSPGWLYGRSALSSGNPVCAQAVTLGAKSRRSHAYSDWPPTEACGNPLVAKLPSCSPGCGWQSRCAPMAVLFSASRLQATRTRQSRTQRRRPLHPIPLVSPRDVSSFRHLGFGRRELLQVQIKRGKIARAESAKIDSETTQMMPLQLDCWISATVLAEPRADQSGVDRSRQGRCREAQGGKPLYAGPVGDGRA